jgi:hypothetical protein
MGDSESTSTYIIPPHLENNWGFNIYINNNSSLCSTVRTIAKVLTYLPATLLQIAWSPTQWLPSLL